MKPEFALMAYGGVNDRTFASFLRDRARDQKYMWSVCVHSGDGAVDRQRSQLLTKFLEGPSDVLVMADHDIVWQVGDITYLAEVAHERQAVVGALVSKKNVREGWGCRLVDGKPHEIGSSEVVELEEDAYTGGALMAVAKSVLVRLARVLPKVPPDFYPFCIPQLKKNTRLNIVEYLSEDWSLCHGARVTGSKVYLAMRPIVIHHGNWGYNTLDANPGAHELVRAA
jgi:hypothetical protein